MFEQQLQCDLVQMMSLLEYEELSKMSCCFKFANVLVNYLNFSLGGGGGNCNCLYYGNSLIYV